jgi:GcrA cell cycle regulator
MASIRRNKPWTGNDSRRLKALVASGATAVRAAAAFNRSISNIRERARHLGTPFPTAKEVRKKYAGTPLGSWRQY